VKFSGTHLLSGTTETDQLVQKLTKNAHKRHYLTEQLRFL